MRRGPQFSHGNRGRSRLNLSPAELQALQLAADHGSNKAIAAECGRSVETVKSHFRQILRKLGVGTKAQAIAIGFRRGLIE